VSASLLFALVSVGADLPVGNEPVPLPVPHFPSRLHAYVWRNYEVVPAERIAEVVGASPQQIVALAKSMGLPDPPRVTEQQVRRSRITVIRRNWHLLPYEQLLALLGCTADELAYDLREDDFLYIKLGVHKPKCEPIRYAEPDAAQQQRAAEMRSVLQRYFPGGLTPPEEPLFGFLDDLCSPEGIPATPKRAGDRFEPRFCYSYFALYGDPLLDPSLDPFPDGYLARLAAVGVNGVWLQAVLYKLAPFPWDPELSEGYETRLANLRTLVDRAARRGIGIYLYLNEPRAMPLAFYDEHPELKGVVEGDHAALCSSAPEVQQYLREAVAGVFRAVPKLAGAFSISGSENLTNCWSHYQGASCPRCGQRTPGEVIAEVNALFAEGVRAGDGNGRMIAWDWGWQDVWAGDVIERLPADVAVQSVSEWSLPIERGGVRSEIGEYSISAVGPGPRATRHWALARARGLRTMAKLQVGNTWELSAVPYIPALELVARHICNLAEVGVDGVQLGWTLGGYPSPNVELTCEISSMLRPDPEEAMRRVASRRFGAENADAVIEAWRAFSTAFAEFPYSGGTVYNAPMQCGPSVLVYDKPTGYSATMVGFPYDDVNGWRTIYPADVFAQQFEKICRGWEPGIEKLRATARASRAEYRSALEQEADVAEAAYLHFVACANLVHFNLLRNEAVADAAGGLTMERRAELARLLRAEIDTAMRLYAIQCRDSRIGFEASNQYYYVPLDLVEKVINCEDLLHRWLGE